MSKEINNTILVHRLLKVLTEWYLADAGQYENFKGRYAEIKDIIKASEIDMADLVGQLEEANFATEIAKKLLQ